jgi:hypothetical protein
MYQHDLDYLMQLCRLTELQRTALVRYYLNLPELVRIEAHALQTDLIRQHRQERRSDCPAEFAYAMLLLALQKMRYTEDGLQRKGRVSLEDARRISELRIQRAKVGKKERTSPLRCKVEVQHGELIKRLRDTERMSWREIAAYLQRYHRLQVSHTYLRSCFAS